MLKKNIKQFLFLLFSIVIVACNEEIVNKVDDTADTNASLTVEKARTWFETTFMEGMGNTMYKTITSDSITMMLKPLLNWDIAQLDNDSIWSVVELPWEYENGKLTMTTSEVSNYCQNNGTKPEQIIRLVILKNRKTGDVYGFKMVVIPDLDYLLAKGDELPVTNYYLNRDSKLSGLVLFYSIDNEFVNGWAYKEGVVTGIVNPYETKSYSKVQKMSNLLNVIAIEICIYTSIEWKGMISYSDDCSTSFYTISSSSGSGAGGSSSGEFDTNYGGGGGSTLNEDGCPGTAFKDECGECVGGTIGKLPCLEEETIDPCAEVAKIKADTALTRRLKDYIDKAKNEPIEYGYMKATNGTFLYPNKQTYKKVSYGTYFDKITERVHTHDNIPGGGTYVFSPEDLMVLYSMFINNKMDNPITFRYIVVSVFGIGSLNITDINAFKEFGKKYNKDKLKNEFDITPRAGNDISDYLKQFMEILKNTNSGLTFSLGEFDMESSNPDIEWNTKRLNDLGSVDNINCN